MRVKRAGLALKSSLVLIGAVGANEVLQARTLKSGETAVVDGPNSPRELWDLGTDSTLVLSGGAGAYEVTMRDASLRMHDASISAANGTGISASNQSRLEIARSSIHDDVGAGVALIGATGTANSRGSSLVMTDTRSTGLLTGVVVGGNSELVAQRSQIESTGHDGAGLLLVSGDVELANETLVRGAVAGVVMGPDNKLSPGRTHLKVSSGSVVEGVRGPAVLVLGGPAGTNPARLDVRDGGSLRSTSGLVVDVRDRGALSLNIDHAEVTGQVSIAADSYAGISIGDRGVFVGAANGPARIALARGGLWSMAGDSHVGQLVFRGGDISIEPGAGAPRTLRVSGSASGTAGGLVLNAHMDAANPEKSWADTLLIEGDVDVLRPVDLQVNVTGMPHGTDVNGNGKADSSEGLSLVQVGGTSTADAFALRNNQLTVGVFQYQLKAFIGDEVDQSASRTETTPARWDYRLVSRVVCEDACDEAPGDSGGGKPGDGKDDNERPAVAPEIASYISAPGAVFAYADGVSTSLHQRLGEIRDHAFEGSTGGELFARYSGKSQRYSSSRSFRDYGYDFDHDIQSWQFGGSLIGLDGDNGSLRAGWAIDHGRSTVTPHAADGASVTRLGANGTSAWITWKTGDGFWMDWVVSQQRLRGNTSTSLGGGEVGRIRATASVASLGAGLPLQVGAGWSIEPHVLVSAQSVRIASIKSAGQVDVTFGGRRYVTTTAGLTIARMDEKFAPFMRLDVRSTSGNAVVSADGVSMSSAARFDSGRSGREAIVSGGMTAQLTPRLQAFGEGSYRHFVGNGGFQGWAGHMGLRLTF